MKTAVQYFHLYPVELQHSGSPEALTLPSFVALCSAALGRLLQSQMIVMGEPRNLTDSLRVAFDAGAKRTLQHM